MEGNTWKGTKHSSFNVSEKTICLNRSGIFRTDFLHTERSDRFKIKASPSFVRSGRFQRASSGMLFCFVRCVVSLS